jgi:hypothetical protein
MTTAGIGASYRLSPGGNPFFLGEVLQHLSRDGHLAAGLRTRRSSTSRSSTAPTLRGPITLAGGGVPLDAVDCRDIESFAP